MKTIIELKAELFDIEQAIKQLQYKYQQVGMELEKQIQEEKPVEEKEK